MSANEECLQARAEHEQGEHVTEVQRTELAVEEPALELGTAS